MITSSEGPFTRRELNPSKERLPEGLNYVHITHPEKGQMDTKTTMELFWQSVNAGVNFIQNIGDTYRINLIIPPLGSLLPTVAALQKLRESGWLETHPIQFLITNKQYLENNRVLKSIYGYIPQEQEPEPSTAIQEIFVMFENIFDTLETLHDVKAMTEGHGELLSFAPIIKQATHNHVGQNGLHGKLSPISADQGVNTCNFAAEVENKRILSSCGINSTRFGVHPDTLNSEIQQWLKLDKNYQVTGGQIDAYLNFVAELEAYERLCSQGLRGEIHDIHSYSKFIRNNSMISNLQDKNSDGHKLLTLLKHLRYLQLKFGCLQPEHMTDIKTFLTGIAEGTITVDFA